MPEKIKVVRLIARLNIGGPAIHTTLLTSGLDPDRYETVFVAGLPEKDEGDMHEFARERNALPIFIPELSRSLNPFRDLAAFWKILRIIRRERPLIVHTHTAKAGALGRIAAWLCRTPVIVHTFHGHVLTGYFGPVRNFLFRATEQLLGRMSTRIIMVSETGRRDLVAMGIVPEEKAVCVPLGLELEKFARCERHAGRLRAEFGIPAGTRILSIVARLVPIKRHEDFLAAAKLIVERGHKVKFFVAGDGSERARLESLAAELGLGEHVIFAGFRADLDVIYPDSDIVALTSLNEGLPVAVIESLAAARPVVATAVGGVGELVIDGETGLLVPAQDPEAFADACCRLLDDPALARRLGERGREHSLSHFSSERLIRDIDNLYTELLRQPRHR